jgi:heat shock protein HslJ
MLKFSNFSWIIAMLFFGCESQKKTTPNTVAFGIHDQVWELEFIAGINRNFEDLYPDAKPNLIFKASSTDFSGNSSCNDFSGKFHQKNNTIRLETLVKTMAYCEGEGENTFFKTLEKINRWRIGTQNQLELMTDTVPIMRFHKVVNKP